MANRTLTFSIFRHDPQAAGSTPHMQEYRLEETPGMSIFIALNRLREEQDPTLQFDFVCRAGICGSCAMVINGKPTLACRTLTATFASPHITLLPLPGFELIGDLSVNTGKFMRALSERIGAWLHPKADSVDIHSVEAPMSPDLADELYEMERCIECGCCIAGCATAQMRDTFMGAVGFNKVARFALDDRDARTLDDFYHVIGNEDGVFGCMSLMGCQDNCPKDINHLGQIAYLRRKLAFGRKVWRLAPR
ncbi:fumarate reductase iron-sulfur subunit [Laribacter hongkongensis]|jgi:fumarate reductase iron-sulfur subunit|uniref:Succinate dehydrogenase iron-sulfur subunit n=2 Tax=Laribacter hongkongensis TaxID=168471 RepID=C1DAY5_LARHH|nr:fumarate reductase iron-sulfur subunit [Laribacter hongkongensis]ACO75324.1 Succinate dehydrogenase and fumarate reductase iron-sulfur protein [Laribacter hongkongensis HLHK9]ASJ25242.1 fumarate reductase [Laribacter hongkongensis]MBE5527911.1 fumarate reductase [Laribacter hongkongensis]MCG8992901.1 fumarate reductase iron-sulfur subunit [Laribacter hongkongensis]MCG8997154.1 fumarate reductase iron-sulfur subunit [Laribacter hongkongensis]